MVQNAVLRAIYLSSMSFPIPSQLSISFSVSLALSGRKISTTSVCKQQKCLNEYAAYVILLSTFLMGGVPVPMLMRTEGATTSSALSTARSAALYSATSVSNTSDGLLAKMPPSTYFPSGLERKH